MVAIRATASVPRILNARPAVAFGESTYNNYWDDEVYALLQSQGSRYRSAPIYIEAGATISHHWGEPIVAGRTMCVSPTVDGGYQSISPTSLISDRWHDMLIATTASLSLDN